MSTEAQGTGVGGADRPATSGVAPGSRLRLHPRVSVRPEPFGALLYHYGTRRLTFIKDRRLLEAVRGLEGQPSVAAACGAAGIGASEQAKYLAALERLSSTDMLVNVDQSNADREGPTT